MIHLLRLSRLLPVMVLTILSMGVVVCRAQSKRTDIYSDYVFYQKRVMLEKDLRERIIDRNFSLPLDSNSEEKYLSACWAVSQFLFDAPVVMEGFGRLFGAYDSISYDLKRAFLEAVYAVALKRYPDRVSGILDRETDPRLFALCAVYLYRGDTTTERVNALKIRMVEKFPGYDTIPVLHELEHFLSSHTSDIHARTPDIAALFDHQGAIGQKIIYSFQRWDRDYPGLAIVQGPDGHFVRDGDGLLQVFLQLARSGPDLPYFITNGSTPQGIFSIQGTDISHTNFIGPTPNLQLIMPFEDRWDRYFQGDSAGMPSGMPAIDSLKRYRELLPAGWRDYAPMMEAWAAGRTGRTEIIAHGTTIDPEYFKDKPFYPLTPTMGCLCAKELWNPTSGHLLVSEQFNLVSAFLSTPGRKGYLFVVNVDDQRRPVSRGEVEAWVKKSGR